MIIFLIMLMAVTLIYAIAGELLAQYQGNKGPISRKIGSKSIARFLCFVAIAAVTIYLSFVGLATLLNAN